MTEITTIDNIRNKIFTIRGMQVMLDRDLSEIYDVETRILNQSVKRNISRFPEKFRFQLTDEETKALWLQNATFENNSLRSQNVTLKTGRGQHRKYLPYVFTEQGVSMLSAVLRSDTAIKVSIQIIDAFVEMRRFITNNAGIFQRLDNIEQKQLSYQMKSDEKFEQLFNAIADKNITPKQGVFFDGQIFDAYNLVADIIRTAKKSIILIDNYIDDTTLQLFTKSKTEIEVIIYTKNINRTLEQDLEKYNSQYETIRLKKLKSSHDRFMIIDKNSVYHFGASLKDVGKKWFAFSKLDIDASDLIEKL